MSRSLLLRSDGTVEAGALDPAALTVAQVAQRAGDPHQPETAARIGRDLAERFGGFRAPDLGAYAHARRGEDVVRIGVPGGDLDGDGLEDAVSIEFRFSVPSGGEWIGLRALRSPNGAERWTHALAGAYDAWPITGHDLNGDGADDVLLYRLDIEEATDDSVCAVVCAGTSALQTRTTMTALDGPTGATLWHAVASDLRTFTGAATPPIGAAVGGGAGTATVAAFPAVVGDQDGDGGADVILNAFRMRWVYAAGATGLPGGEAIASWLVQHVESRGSVVSGGTGAPLLERAQGERQSSGTALVAAGDVTADDVEDLIWYGDELFAAPSACASDDGRPSCAGFESYRLDAELIDGASHEAVWQRTIVQKEERGRRTAAVLVPSRTDLNGRPGEDLLLVESVHSGRIETLFQGVVDGAGGDVQWRAETTRDGQRALIGIPIGAVGGLPGGDLLVPIYGGHSGMPAVWLQRRDGASGSILFETMAALPENPDAVAVIVTIEGDADADGVTDVVVDLPADDLDWNRLQRSLTRVESGRDGGTLLERWGGNYTTSMPVRDLDGIPGDDLLFVAVDRQGHRVDVRISAFGLASNSVRWSRHDKIPNSAAYALFPSADQTGDGVADVLYSRAHFRSEFDGWQEYRIAEASRIDGIDAGDGGITWGIGEELATPQPEGAVSGVVLEESGAPVSICVAAFETDGTHVGQDTAEPDGRWRIGGLRPGNHVLQIWDCMQGKLRVEYYRDKTTFSEADTVAVEADRDTGGIDIVVSLAE